MAEPHQLFRTNVAAAQPPGAEGERRTHTGSPTGFEFYSGPDASSQPVPLGIRHFCWPAFLEPFRVGLCRFVSRVSWTFRGHRWG